MSPCRRSPKRSHGRMAARGGARCGHDAPVLQLANVRKAFGGLVAVDDLASRCAAAKSRPDRPERLRQDHGAQPDLRRAARRLRRRSRSRAGRSHCCRRIASRGAASRAPSSSCACCRPRAAWRTSWPGLRFTRTPLWGAEAEDRAARACSTRVGLGDKADTPAGQLTYIDQKRLELARALALSPDVLLLDEWLAGLNPIRIAGRHRADPNRCARKG